MILKLYTSLSLICFIYVQVDAQAIRREDGFDQQIQSKVQRINLKDFGFESRSSNRKLDKNVPKISVESRLLPPEDDIPSNRDFNRNWRHSRRPFAGRSYSRRDLPAERHKSSPLEWTSSTSGIGSSQPNPVSQTHLRRAFNFSSAQTLSTRKRNCSEECVLDKYLQHYRAKACSPVWDYECDCALNYRCSSRESSNSTVCEYQGRIYQIGSRIPVRNPCRICECRDFGRRRGEPMAEIDCGIGIECPEAAFGLKPEPNCYFGYQRDQCCGHQICENTLLPKRQQKVCRYKQRQYKLGQKIYPDEDNCKMCLCTEDWDDEKPLSSGACFTYSCDFELEKDFQNGCLPIYHEGTCCPIEYKCPKTFAIESQKSDEKSCVFDGGRYPIGSTLVTENVCVDCVCKTPPDFTCIHKSCSTPPLNCYVGQWDHNVCCQKYICSRPDHIRDESQFRNNFYSKPIDSI